MSKKKYWKSFEELEGDPQHVESKKNEFSEKLPVVDALQKDIPQGETGRRDFLKVLGFSLGAATVAASCEMPIRKAIPYVVKPEEITPGVPTYYASTFVDGSDFCPIVVKTREGRPIKIEGNDLCKSTGGGTSARAQASVIGLYDSSRLRGPVANGQATTWEELDRVVSAGLSASRGQVVLLTSSLLSSPTRRIADALAQKYGAKTVVWESISHSGILKANEQSFGAKVIPSYNFAQPDVIVGVECDFLGTWLSPTEFSSAYVGKRKVDGHNKKMSQHFQFESNVSITGSKADYRRAIKPSQAAAVLLDLLKAVGGPGSGSGVDLGAASDAIKKAGAALKGATGRAMVVCGVNDVNCQLITNAINNAIGSYGRSIDLTKPYNTFQGDDQEMVDLVNQMNAGRVGTLIINNVNPAYDYPEAAKFVSGLAKVGTSVSLNARADETAEHVKFLAPAHHYLESWDVLEPREGMLSFVQPTIAPLFDTRQMADSLMKWAGIGGDYYTYLQSFVSGSVAGRLVSNGNGGDNWSQLLHDGIAETRTGGNEQEEGFGGTLGFSGNVSAAVSALSNLLRESNGIEIKLYESIAMGNGKYANNPFLQEVPDPIAKVSWENVLIAPKSSGYSDGDVVKISANGAEVELPVMVQPGLKEGVFAAALGYGRTKPGNERCATGGNLFPMAKFNGASFSNYITGATVTSVSSGYPLAITQHQNTIDDEREIINETTLDKIKGDPFSGNKSGRNIQDEHYLHHWNTLYPGHADQLGQGHHWGMSVDLNTCTGCAACLVACSIENNVPVVGKTEVKRMHDMHWIRIDRYYSYDRENDPNMENPEVAFMPMMCNHCDNAPCENVCPVNATNHSSEGLNQMAYNRCIGTRYCANNCPFKVRRFNWYDFQGSDSFNSGSVLDNDQTFMDNLSRMVLNPDVTVRSRGVIEKCSFCVQRIQEGKLEAKNAGRKLEDGAIITACQAACATGAIVFGDMNDKQSAVVKAKENQRDYVLLQDIQLLPSVSYQTMVRNKEAIEATLPDGRVKDDGSGGHNGHDSHGGHDDHGKGKHKNEHKGHDKKHDGHDHKNGHDSHDGHDHKQDAHDHDSHS